MIFLEKINSFDDRHPVATSFFISLVLMSLFLFYSPSLTISNLSDSTDNIQIVNIEKIAARKKIVKKTISTTEGDPTKTELVSRSSGTSYDKDAVDTAFNPSISLPRLQGRLKKYYPKVAKDENVEAILNVELIIAPNGKVYRVRILNVKLTKSFPEDVYKKISRAFRKDAKRILKRARFNPTIIQGKKVPLKMQMPLRFKLEDAG